MTKRKEATDELLTKDSLVEYIQSVPEVGKQLVNSDADWSSTSVEEIGDGNINYIFLVKCQVTSKAVIVKQSPSFIRIVGPDWPLDSGRSAYEHECMVKHHQVAPQHVPRVIFFDKERSVIVMEYLPPPHIILRKGLIQMTRYDMLAEHISTFLANTIFFTSSLALSTKDKRLQVALFSGNWELCQTTEQVIFTEPYITAKNNRWNSPLLDEVVQTLHADATLRLRINDLKSKFQTETQSLIHGDLHTGSFMVTSSTTYVIDAEFAFYGPSGFDIGAVMGNMFLNYFCHTGHATDETSDQRNNYAEWLLDQVVAIWNLFQTKFIALWNTKHCGDVYSPAFVSDVHVLSRIQNTYMASLLKDAAGFAAAKMIRRLVGIAHVEDFESIADIERRAAVEGPALMAGMQLLRSHTSVTSIDDVCEIVRQHRV